MAAALSAGMKCTRGGGLRSEDCRTGCLNARSARSYDQNGLRRYPSDSSTIDVDFSTSGARCSLNRARSSSVERSLPSVEEHFQGVGIAFPTNAGDFHHNGNDFHSVDGPCTMFRRRCGAVEQHFPWNGARFLVVDPRSCLVKGAFVLKRCNYSHKERRYQRPMNASQILMSGSQVPMNHSQVCVWASASLL